MSIGIDIVDINELEKKLQRGDEFIELILTHKERENVSLETIAGKIAAKEAIIKTGFLKAGKWHEVVILNNSEGSPAVYDRYQNPIKGLQISISHTKDLAVAVVNYEKNV